MNIYASNHSVASKHYTSNLSIECLRYYNHLINGTMGTYRVLYYFTNQELLSAVIQSWNYMY